MLKEILCNKFREKKISFHKGLNVVLGDNYASNSIGKSSLLMVIDFVFGGETFVSHHADAIKELGHHEYLFMFEFRNQKHYFKRSTISPDVVFICRSDYSEDIPIPLKEYTDFLKKEYGLFKCVGSFRSLISTYSRIWGKNNLDVSRPLHSFPAQNARDSINSLIKLFGRYFEIQELTEDLKNATNSKDALNTAFKGNLIGKINSNKYVENAELISDTNKEITNIRESLSVFALNLSQITNKEVLALKDQKDELLELRLHIKSRLHRVKRNLNEKRYIKSSHFLKLKDFFPHVNIDRLGKIESFHAGISKIMRNELITSEKNLTAQLEEVDTTLNSIDNKLKETFSSVENPSIIIDRVVELSNAKRKASTENKYFEMYKKEDANIKELKKKLKGTRSTILDFLKSLLNHKMRSITTIAYTEERKSPFLKIEGSTYSFEIYEDTGTGKAYSSLIIFDLSIFETTELPFLIHDSLLFKNIENKAVANLVELYSKQNRQSFIAIDEINKYGQHASEILRKNRVIMLDTKNVLFIKDWRK